MQLTTKQLCRAVELGYQRMKTARDARYKFLTQYVGPFYSRSKAGDPEDRKAAPLNLMYKAVSTMVPNLVYNEPTFEVSTELLPYREYAMMLSLALNHLSRKIHLRDTLRRAITDSLFGPAFIKIGLAVGEQTLDMDGRSYNVGMPFVDNVDVDDIVIDPTARTWEEKAFVGNRFRIKKSSLLESGQFDNGKIEQLQSRYQNAAGVNFRKEAGALGGDASAILSAQEVYEYVDLVELFVPDEQLLITIPYGAEGKPDDILRVAEYDGPDCGPYYMLGYQWVPDNPLPIPPASIWYQLHILSNRISRKVARQAERMKRNLIYEPTAMEDVKAIADADDGETVAVDDVNRIKEVNYGGTTDEAYKYLDWVKHEFSEQAGNIDLLAGVGADAPTATQSQMLQTNSSVRLQDMQNIVYSFTGDIGRHLVFLLHTDPLIDMALVRRVPQTDPMTGMATMGAEQVFYTPEMRQGTWLDYSTRTRPYSMARQDPNVKAKRVMDFMSSVIPAVAQAAQLLGPGFNVDSALNLAAREIGLEEADELINSPLLQQWMATRLQMVPADGKAPGAAPPGGGPPQPGGIRPQQPNPMATGPQGGQTPQQEQRQMVQQGAPQPAAM